MGRKSTRNTAPEPVPPPATEAYTKPTRQQYAQQEISEDLYGLYKDKFRPVEIDFLNKSKNQNLEPYGITRSSAEVMQKTKLNPEAFTNDDGRKHTALNNLAMAQGQGLAAGNRQSILNEEQRSIQQQLNLLKMGSGQAVNNLQTASAGAGQSVSAAMSGLSSTADASYAMDDNWKRQQQIANQNKADNAAMLGGVAGIGLSMM